MKTVPNDIVTTICRCLPQVLGNLDQDAIRKNSRLANSVRLLRFKVLPKLTKLDKQ